jgi:hypothetical protein
MRLGTLPAYARPGVWVACVVAALLALPLLDGAMYGILVPVTGLALAAVPGCSDRGGAGDRPPECVTCAIIRRRPGRQPRGIENSTASPGPRSRTRPEHATRTGGPTPESALTRMEEPETLTVSRRSR